jgi:methylenetetrahydrofolate reductase (NADPH)
MAAIDDPKIVELSAKAEKTWFSFEYFPPKTEDGVKNLHKRIDRMKQLGPLFVDFTWGAGGSTSDLSLQLTASAKKDHGCVASMHLTCTNQKVEMAGEALAECKKEGIRNIVALRGDPPRGQEKWEATEGGFCCALDLVKHMKTNFGDYFNISVACYPEGHPDNIEVVESLDILSDAEKRRARVAKDAEGKEVITVCRDAKWEIEMKYLKEKCDAGAEMLITQMFLDPQVYADFVADCKKWEINALVIPGIMCLTGIGGLKRMTELCKTRLPEGFMDAAEAAANVSDDKFKEWGIQQAVSLCKSCVEAGAPGLHFYTLNLEKVCIGTLKGLEFITEEQAAACTAGDADAKSMVSAQGITVDKKMVGA